MIQAAVQLEDVSFDFGQNQNLFQGLNFQIAAQEKVFVQGSSGSGKSTLLGLLGGVLQPTKGKIFLLGSELTQMSMSSRDRFRADHLGIVFQLFNLLPYLSVLENTTLPCLFSNTRAQRAGDVDTEARRLLNRLDLEQNLLQRPVTELSVGQQQRVAVARALIGQPEILIADEPTSALDADMRRQFIDLLLQESKDTTVVFVSHDASLAPYFDRMITMSQLQ